MRPLISLPVMLVLAACSQGEPAPAETAAPAGAPTAASSTPAAAPQIAVIPEPFQGIWDFVEGSCDPASDMRTEVAERGITFYESHGAVTALTAESPERIKVELAMQGEGEKWTMTRTFTLSAGGTILTPTGGGDTGEPMALKRCQV